jgi:hypothetical protein
LWKEIIMKSQVEIARIQGKIDVLNTALDRIYDQAEAEKRTLTSEEKKVARGLEAEVKNFEAEIAEAPLTVSGYNRKLGGSGPFP